MTFCCSADHAAISHQFKAATSRGYRHAIELLLHRIPDLVVYWIPVGTVQAVERGTVGHTGRVGLPLYYKPDAPAHCLASITRYSQNIQNQLWSAVNIHTEP